jgi:hypothetical protein
MKTRIQQLDFRGWIYSLGASVIGGTATSASAWLGIAAAKSAGVDVPDLNLKALGIILLSGALTNLFAFLAKSPLPPPETDTQP